MPRILLRKRSLIKNKIEILNLTRGDCTLQETKQNGGIEVLYLTRHDVKKLQRIWQDKFPIGVYEKVPAISEKTKRLA